MLYFEFETWIILSYILQIATLFRVLLRENRSPASRLAWMLCVMAVPWLGIILYFLFGEVGFGRKDVERMEAVLMALPKCCATDNSSEDSMPVMFRQAFARAGSVNTFSPTTGNRATLMENSDHAIANMIGDIDAATDHVHLLFYIWLTDNNGMAMVEACIRAAKRGVTVRAMVDGMGSRHLIKSEHWQRMADSGVHVGVAFDMQQTWLHLLFKRVDIRNHRKIMVVDNQITYCGSQNCADPEFTVKAKFAPWVDIMIRLTGPIVWQQQVIFAGDWQTHTGEDINDILRQPVEHRHGDGDVVAISMGTGPTESHQAVPDVFQNLMASAQHEIIVSTPYYVPSEALHNRLCAAALRGVDVTLILPQRNDSKLVGMASRSYFLALVRCGVKLYEYKPGLLHSKLLTVDDQAVLFGSANLDRRSFDINFENCMLAYDPTLAQNVNARQREYIADSELVSLDRVEGWPVRIRLMNNLFATMGPLL
ncbi:MAG: cardiolipin synthase [Pseudoruegeria sp.]